MTSTKILNKIRKLRLDKGFSQENMADELQTSRTSYARLENGETELTWRAIDDIAKILTN